MGYKGDKKRPGREADRPRCERWQGVESACGRLTVHLDTHTGDLYCTGDCDHIKRAERDRITREVVDLLTKFG